ncbi:hypothetical protein RIF29_19095 [Crotalaria pallida]|uniref:Uncharacterized protein n=1 Tax=Crotalaria pallida TaxID=3830 RepID=A0AAN9F064_CROPI
MLQQHQFGGRKSFAMNHDILKDVLTFHHKSRERDNLERNDDNYVDVDESSLGSLIQGDRQEKLIMSFLRFARNCACHITSLSASAIEKLLEENWPNLLCAVYDLNLISSTSIIYNKHRMCHNNIANDRDAIVLSKSGGKLGAIKGCQGRCFNHVGRDLIDLRNVVSRHLNLGSSNPNKFLQFLGDLRYENRYFAPATPFRLLAGHPIWMSPAARMHMRYAFYNKVKRLPTIDQRNFRKGCRSRVMLQLLQFGGWKSLP